MTVRVYAPPSVDDYYTDGRRLVQVLGFTKNGDCIVEDVATDETLEMNPAELARPGVWKPVNGTA